MLHRSASRTVLLAAALLALTATLAQAATKIHWYGQAAFRIETPSGGVILIDPWLKVPTNPDKESIAKLGRVDYILITHGHWDHIGDAIEIAKKTGATLVAPYGLQFNMKSVLGYPEKQATLATGGNVGGTIDLPKAGAKVSYVNAVHGSELVPPMVQPSAPGQAAAIASGNPVGYVLQINGGPTLYHTGDTDVFTDMKLIAEFFKVDVMLAVIGGFVFSLGGVFFLLGGIPLAAVVAIFALELLIACLQAYVFAVLTCIYLNDAIHMAH